MALPAHLVPIYVRRALGRASNLVALVCLVVDFMVVLALQADSPARILWPALLAITVMGASLFLRDYLTEWQFSIGYLIVGAACIYWVAIVAASEFPGPPQPDSFALSLMRIALIMVGGSASTALRGVVLSATALVLCGVATVAALNAFGSPFHPDHTAVVTLVLYAALQVGLALSAGRLRIALPWIHRAARDEQLAEVRLRAETRAAAMVHDTVLNHLAAIAASGSPALRADLREQIERDLEVLIGEEWLIDSGGAEDPSVSAEWTTSALWRVIDDVRGLGLSVDVNGELSAISRLPRDRASALALAAKQCLINVHKHARAARAEVVVYGTPTDVSVMIIDDGVGFLVDETAVDRLGLRHSVRHRIESIGGSVQLWSTPGAGTSVMIRVPATEGEL